MIVSGDWWSDFWIDREWFDFVSIMAIDPGETTGMYRALLDVRSSGVWRGSRSLLSAVNTGGLQVSVPPGDQMFMVREAQAVGRILRMMQVSFNHHTETVRDLGSPPNSSNAALRLGFIVVCEDFTLRERTADRSLLSPVRLTSMIVDHLHAWRMELQFFMQSPSDKSIVTDDIIKRFGLWQPGQPHMMDALRHLNLFLRKCSVR